MLVRYCCWTGRYAVCALIYPDVSRRGYSTLRSKFLEWFSGL